MLWLKTFNGFVGDSPHGRYMVRGPIFGKACWWLYLNSSRFTPTGRFEDALSFPTAAAAKRYVEGRTPGR